jgi:hypothetical protein
MPGRREIDQANEQGDAGVSLSTPSLGADYGQGGIDWRAAANRARAAEGCGREPPDDAVSDGGGELAGLPAITYEAAHRRHTAGSAERRLDELGVIEDGRALTKGERLEEIALAMVLARWHQRPEFRDALSAGATWEQIAAARGTSVARARLDYLEWAEHQHDLWTRYKAEARLGEDRFDHAIGISDAMYAEALRHVAMPGA